MLLLIQEAWFYLLALEIDYGPQIVYPISTNKMLLLSILLGISQPKEFSQIDSFIVIFCLD